jgi:hypothetical protein
VVAAYWLALQGLLAYAGGRGIVTSTGQLRSLFSPAAPVLLGSLYVGIWMYVRHEWTSTYALVAALPVAGLVFINHRSVYLAAIVSLAVFAAMRMGWSRVGASRTLSRIWVPALVLAVLGVALTPEGRGGVERFLTITNRADPNISARIGYTRNATNLNRQQWIFGKGVGTQRTNFSEQESEDKGQKQVQTGTHNSFAKAVNLGGVIGFGLLFAPVAYLLALAWRRRGDPLVQILTALAVYGLVVAAFNVVLENIYLSISVWFPLVLVGKLALGRSARAPAPR